MQQQPQQQQQQAQFQPNSYQPQQTTTISNGMQQPTPTFQQPVMSPYVVRAPTFRRIKVRHSLFKAGVGLLVFSTVVFVVGYSAPAWSDRTGLWMSCGFGGCNSNTLNGPDWLEAVRVMETIALILFLAAIAVELYQDVFKSPPPVENKAVEILAVLAGFFGLIGIIVFGAKLQLRLETYNGNGYYWDTYYTYRHFQWGYGLATAGVILVLVSAALIAVSRAQHAALTNQAMAACGVMPPVGMQRSPQAVMVPMQPMQPMMNTMQMAPGYYPAPMPAYPYAYPYPAPGMTPMVTPHMVPQGMPMPQEMPMSQGMPTSQGAISAPGMPTSQVPVFYVMNQGQMVPVYNEMPAMGAASPAASASQQPAPGPVASPDAPTTNGEVSLKL